MSSRSNGPHLRVTQGKNEGTVFGLAQQTTRIGRDSSNDIVFNEMSVSRYHAELVLLRSEEPRFILRDLDSANGTFIRQGRQEEAHIFRVKDAAPVFTGDEILLGSNVILVLHEGIFEPDNDETIVLPFPMSSKSGTRKVDVSKYGNVQLEDLEEAVFSYPLPPLDNTIPTLPKPVHGNYLFISHSAQDDHLVNQLYYAMMSQGIPVWIDHKHLKPGDNQTQATDRALKGCWGGLLVVSRAAQSSLNCIGEREYLLREYQRERKQLYVALINGMTVDDLHYGLHGIQYINLSVDFDANLRELVSTIRTHAVTVPIPKPQIIDNSDKDTENAATHVFISYSHSQYDESIMRRVRDTLKEAGLTVWIDPQDHEPGSRGWNLNIERAIDNSRCVVAIFSQMTRQSDWVRSQLEYAQDMNKPVFGVLTNPGTGMLLNSPLEIRVDIQRHYELEMERLIAAIKRYLRRG